MAENHVLNPPEIKRYQSLSSLFFLSIFTSLILISCGESANDPLTDQEAVPVDTLQTESFQELSNFFGRPIEIVRMDEERFAVNDIGLSKIKVLSVDGTELFEFGGEGRGPGEWSEFGLFLSYSEGRFIVSDIAGLRINVYDETGASLSEIPLDPWLQNTSKFLIRDSELVMATNGLQDALALVFDIDNPETPLLKLGTPIKPLPVGDEGIEQVSEQIARGEVPSRIINDSIMTGSEAGYYLIMNTLGEVRFYNLDGDLEWTRMMPQNVIEPIHNYFKETNERYPPDYPGYTSIEYVAGVRFANDSLFIITRPIDDMPQYLLVYSADGELTRQIVFDSEEETTPQFGRFEVMPDGTMLMTDFENSRIVTFQL